MSTGSKIKFYRQQRELAEKMGKSKGLRWQRFLKHRKILLFGTFYIDIGAYRYYNVGVR